MNLKPRVLFLLVPLLAASCTLVPPEEDPLFIKISEVDSRLARVERVIDNEGLMNLLQQIEQLRQTTQALRNDVDELQFELGQAGERQRQQYMDVDQRLQSLERSLDRRPVAGADQSVLDGARLAPGELPVPGGSDRANYQAAFELLKQGRYKEANQALRQFMVAFPESELSDNAQYWLAETHYVGQEFQRALTEFQKVIDQYPESRKIPDALLKIGYSNYELKRYQAARQALQTVVSTFPETTAARLAGERLSEMSSQNL